MIKYFLVLVAVLAPSFVFAAGPNLIPNPGFDTNTTGWAPVIGTGNSTSFTYPGVGNDGSNAAKIVVSSYSKGDIFWQPTKAPVVAGKQYEFSGYSLNSAPVSVIATYLNSSGSAVSYATLATIPASSAWQKFSATVTIPTGVTGVRIQHVLRAVGSLTIDSYSLGLFSTSTATTTPPVATTTPPVTPPATTTPPVATTTPPVIPPPATTTPPVVPPPATTTPPIIPPPATTTPPVATTTPPVIPPPATTTPPVATTTPPVTPPTSGVNLIKNPNLETGNTNAPTNWTGDYWGNLTAQFTYPVTGKGGGKAAKVQVTSYTNGDAKWFPDHVAVSSHTIYQYSEDYLATAPSSITIEYRMQDGTYNYQWVQQVPTSATWSTISLPITVPTGAISLTVLHALSSTGSLTIDNTSLIAKTNNAFAQGMVTLAFDDGLKSQYTNALPILTSAGYKGGFYIITTEPTSGDTAYMTWAQIKDLKNKGHEVGAHTRTHPMLGSLSAAQLQNELKGSYNDLVAQGITPKTIVYPLGDVNTAVEQATKVAGYSIARGSYFGFNDNEADHYNLMDIRLDQTSTLATIQKYIDQVVADKRWVVFELHDVKTNGDAYAITPAFFQSVVTYLKQKGVKVVSLEQGLAELKP